MRNQITYALDLGSRQGRTEKRRTAEAHETPLPIPRIARLMALAIRLEGSIREGKLRDHAEAARLGRVTRARMTQIMKLLDLAPDIQEAILFLTARNLNERNLRPIVKQTDWAEQRRMFQRITEHCAEVTGQSVEDCS